MPIGGPQAKQPFDQVVTLWDVQVVQQTSEKYSKTANSEQQERVIQPNLHRTQGGWAYVSTAQADTAWGTHHVELSAQFLQAHRVWRCTDL